MEVIWGASTTGWTVNLPVRNLIYEILGVGSTPPLVEVDEGCGILGYGGVHHAASEHCGPINFNVANTRPVHRGLVEARDAGV